MPVSLEALQLARNAMAKATGVNVAGYPNDIGVLLMAEIAVRLEQVDGRLSDIETQLANGITVYNHSTSVLAETHS